MDRKLQFLEIRERFIPVSQAAIGERMLGDRRLSGEEREQLVQLFEMIAQRFHFEFRRKLERLEELYEPFDPDRDTLPLGAGVVDAAEQERELAEAFGGLLLDANYLRMPREQVLACAEYQARTGLVVEANLSDYGQLEFYYRGIRHEWRKVRWWLAPWRQRSERVHVFRRVAVLVRLARHPNGPVFLKVFKNVVAEDLEMLLPHVRIRMRLRDHLKIGSSVAGGVATTAWKLITATILSPWLFLLVVSGFIGAAVRGIFSFLSSRTKYLQALSSNLYFQNMANNSSALAHLIDAAEKEECKELLMVYYLLYVERQQDFTEAEIDRRVEQWLNGEFGVEVDFEVADALRKLAEKDLLVRRSAAGDGAAGRGEVLKVYDLPSALRRLDAAWDAAYPWRDLRSREEDRVADAAWPAFAEPGR